MESFREFQGAALDDCINQAREWFDCPREELEIEIIQDAKTGIFGIVGARKAKIRARRARVAETMRDILGRDQKSEKNKSAKTELRQPSQGHDKISEDERQPTEQDSDPSVGRSTNVQARKTGHKDSSENQKHNAPRHKKGHGHNENKIEEKAEGTSSPQKILQHKAAPPSEQSAPSAPHAAAEKRQTMEQAKPHVEDARSNHDLDDSEMGPWPVIPVEELDTENLEKFTLEVVEKLVQPIADREVGMTFDISNGQPRVKIEWEGDAGLLIGRDGQTLIAIQYLASRILSKHMQASLRVRLDIGEYRAKQSERLRGLALHLAEKARRFGRSYSTRPLSSYHRRVIHLSLQNAPDIQTRSSGDGPLKRVIIMPRRG